jgi:hypothetical protein
VIGERYRRGTDVSSAEETEYSLLLKSPKTQRWREMEKTEMAVHQRGNIIPEATHNTLFTASITNN